MSVDFGLLFGVAGFVVSVIALVLINKTLDATLDHAKIVASWMRTQESINKILAERRTEASAISAEPTTEPNSIQKGEENHE